MLNTLVAGTPAYIVAVTRLREQLAKAAADTAATTPKPASEVLGTEAFEFLWKAVLSSWDASKAALEEAKATEMELRKEFVALASDPNKKKGTEHFDIGDGYDAKIGKKINYGWIKNAEDKTDIDAIDNALRAIEAKGPVGAYVASNLVKWTPDLSITEYNKLVPEFKAIIDTVIKTTDGAPTLEIVAPKGKR